MMPSMSGDPLYTKCSPNISDEKLTSFEVVYESLEPNMYSLSEPVVSVGEKKSLKAQKFTVPTILGIGVLYPMALVSL